MKFNDQVITFSREDYAQRLRRVLTKSRNGLEVEVFQRTWLEGFIIESKKL